jgi:hypothetical protein
LFLFVFLCGTGDVEYYHPGKVDDE